MIGERRIVQAHINQKFRVDAVGDEALDDLFHQDRLSSPSRPCQQRRNAPTRAHPLHKRIHKSPARQTLHRSLDRPARPPWIIQQKAIF